MVLLARLFDSTALSRLGLLKKQVRLRALTQEVTQVNRQLALNLRGEGQQICFLLQLVSLRTEVSSGLPVRLAVARDARLALSSLALGLLSCHLELGVGRSGVLLYKLPEAQTNVVLFHFFVEGVPDVRLG